MMKIAILINGMLFPQFNLMRLTVQNWLDTLLIRRLSLSNLTQ